MSSVLHIIMSMSQNRLGVKDEVHSPYAVNKCMEYMNTTVARRGLSSKGFQSYGCLHSCPIKKAFFTFSFAITPSKRMKAFHSPFLTI